MLAPPSTPAIPAGFGFPERALPPMEPGSWVLTRAAIEAWAERARPGKELVYARGPRPPQSDGMERLNELLEARAVTLATRKIAPDDYAFFVQRLPGDLPVAGAKRSRLSVRGPLTETNDQIADLMGELRRLANRDLPCKTNRELGEDLGGLSPDRIAYLLRTCISNRLISVESLGPGVRVVTILSTGKHTRKP
jgi:hypothetical protein